jgi:hypothetical protein
MNWRRWRGRLPGDKTRIDAFIEASRTTFDASQEGRRDAYDDLAKELRTKLIEDTAALTATNDQSMAAAAAAATASLERIEELDGRAQEFYESVTKIALAGGYGHQAEEERKQADMMRWVAIGLGVAAAVLAVLALGDWWPETGFDTPHTLLKLASSLSVLSIAGYVVGQSRVHRRREERWRDIQLQLAAIEPFLRQSPFDDKTRMDLLQVFALRTFVGQRGADDDGEVGQVLGRILRARSSGSVDASRDVAKSNGPNAA